MSGLCCGTIMTGPVWSSRVRSITGTRSKRHPCAWFSRPRLTDVAPYLSLDLLTPRQSHAREPLRRPRSEFGRSRPWRSAPRRRGRSFASATMTSIGGLRASMRASHEPADTPLRLAQRTTPLAAMISKREACAHPCATFGPAAPAPGRSLYRGKTDPGGKVPARPEGLGRRREYLDGGRDQGPDPGTVMSRRATSSVFARADFAIKGSNLVLQPPQHLDEAGEGTSAPRPECRKPDPQSIEPCDVRGTLRSDHAVLGEVPAQGIDDLGALADEQIALPEDHSRCLLGLALDGHEGDPNLAVD